jgi:hypothetical protein
VPAGPVLAAALLCVPSFAEPAARPDVVSYELTESTRTFTPAGERTRTSAGTVSIAGGKARWELARTAAFPRSSAGVAIVDGAVVTLLDTKERLAASATLDDFTALFRGRPATEGAAAVAVKDVSAKVQPGGAGRVFEGRPTARFSVDASWTLVVSAPGRIARVATSVKGTIDALDEPAARSAFDALGRLLPARGEAAEALDAELARVQGLPVSASFDVASKTSVEQPGPPSAADPPPAPVETRQTIARKVEKLAVRKGAPADDALFSIPEDFHSRSLERIAPEVP